GAFPDVASGTQVRIRAEHSSVSDSRIFHHASRTNEDTVPDFRVGDHGIGTDSTIRTNLCAAEQLNECLDYGVGASFHVGINHAGVWIKDGYASSHQRQRFFPAECTIEINQFGAGVAA